ncbi:DJ-1/PfpI family protein [Schaalia sp. ZJ405]|uniref:DJ-1 family glyoxalase III n=1 Tax=Schaalia sp. ZJ405 TaxID=2709403 RepID=UPI0013E9DA24|nr:DJ-1 family glyoxalase III [Schaalia sp. ZJ405]QPK81655.1 DJ-1/PfpI family protein [Schaalia sp. ZJ405]
MPTPTPCVTDQSVAVLIASGLEEVEALAVVDVLYRAGIRSDLIAVGDQLEIESSHGIRLICERLLSDTDLSDYSLVFLPGGLPGTLNLGDCDAVTAEVRRRGETGELISAICAAPSVLAQAGILDGIRATANPGFMDAIAQGGAVISEDAVVHDGAVITSRGMGTAVELGLEIVQTLLGDDAVAEVKKGIVYQR